MKRRFFLFLLPLALALPVFAGNPPVPYVMSTGNYSEGFGDVANWTDNFATGIGAAPWASIAVNATGAIPDGKKITTATAAFVSGGSGGVQKGSGALVLLSTGSTDNSSACAVDLFLDFTGRTVGTLSFDYAEIDNGATNSDRAGSVRVYTSTDGTAFTELSAASVLNLADYGGASGSRTAVALPGSFSGSSTARIRFYYYNGTGGATGSRPKISVDNLSVTSTSTSKPGVVTPPASTTNFAGDTAAFSVAAVDADGYQWFKGSTPYTNGGNVSGATSSILTLTTLSTNDATTNITVVLSNAFGFTTSAPPASLTVVVAPQSAFKYMHYNVDGNSISGLGITNWQVTAPQVQAIGRELVFQNPDIVAFNEIPSSYKSEMTNWVNAFLPGYYLASNAGGDGSIQNFVVSRFPILNSISHLHSADLAPYGYTNSDFTRDLFEAQINVPGLGGTLHVFVAHLKATVSTPQDDANKRAAEAAAISNYFVNVFLPGNGSDPYLLSGDMNEDIIRPETSAYTSGQPIQKLTNGTGLFLTTPVNPATGSELTESIRLPLSVRFDYIMPCGLLYSNITSSQVFRTDVLNPTPAGLSNNDDYTASDHLPLVMLFQNPFAATAPSINSQPLSQVVTQGNTATFSVAASGGVPLYYQWQKDGNNLANGGHYSGVTNATLVISNTSQLDEGAYSVTVSNAYGFTNSDGTATLGLITPSEALAIWNFNSLVSDTNPATGATTPSFGSGAASFAGNTTATFGGGTSRDPADSGGDNSSWDTVPSPKQGTSNKLEGVQFAVSTVGHGNIFVSYYEEHSGTASRYMRFQYTTNGTDFVDDDLETFTTANAFTVLKQHDLTGTPGVDNNPDFAFRVVAEFESSAIGTTNTNYVPTSSASYGTSGTAHFDMVEIDGVPLIAPSVSAPLDVVTQAGSTVSFSVTATGSAPFSYQWRKGGTDLVNGGITSGATAATLTLTGVALSDAGSYSVFVANEAGSVTSSVASLTITCPAISLGGLADGTNTVFYTHSIIASGGVAPYSYFVAAGSVPAGLILATDGTLSGTPTAASTYSFTVVATDADGCTGTNACSVTINPRVCPAISLGGLADGTNTIPYSLSITGSGGVSPYSFALAGGSLPAGLSLSSGGALTGTPTTISTNNFTVVATDANGCIGTNAYTMIIHAFLCPVITLDTLPDAVLSMNYSNRLVANGGAADYTYALAGGGLPAGLTLSSNLLHGTPTATGTTSFTILVTDTNGCSSSSNILFTVDCPQVTITVPAAPAKAKKVNLVVTASPASSDYAYTASGLPGGLSITNTTGHIGGTATNYGTYSVTVTVSNKVTGCTSSTNVTWIVTVSGGDHTQPTISILSPKNNAVIQTNAPINVTGKVGDNALVTNVVYWLNQLPTAPATVATAFSATNFSISIASPAAVNTLYVQSVDLSGNTSKLATVTFNYGTHAFATQAGTYYGLFSPAGGVGYEDSGFAKIKVSVVTNKLPSFTGTVIVGGRTAGWPISGTFKLDGTAALGKPVSRVKQTDRGTLGDLSAVLHLPLTGEGELTGTITAAASGTATSTADIAGWSADLESYLSLSPLKVGTADTNYDSQYTVAIPAPATNYGDGYASLLVVTGKVSLSGGKLANGQGFAGVATYLSADGDWPLMSVGDKIPGGVYKSMLLGWLKFNRLSVDPANNLVWISKGGVVTYPAGFTNDVSLMAATYNPNIGSGLVLNLGVTWTNYIAYLSNNVSLVTNIANPVVLTNSAAGKNKFIDSLASKTNKANSLVLTITPKTGIIAGSFKGDGQGQSSIGGIALQSSNYARGYFIATKNLANAAAPGTNSGTFYLQQQ